MNILAKMKETAVSVLPVMAIVLFLGFTFVPLDKLLLARFVAGGLLLIIGLTIFLLGVDLGIQPMGERCGAELTKKRSLRSLSKTYAARNTVYIRQMVILFLGAKRFLVRDEIPFFWKQPAVSL